jgi:hypothetical protein
MENRKYFVSGAHSTNNLQPLIPPMPIPPKEMCPFSAQQSLSYPTSLLGLQQQAGTKFSERCSYSFAPTKNKSPTILLLRELIMGLKNHFFNPTPR